MKSTVLFSLFCTIVFAMVLSCSSNSPGTNPGTQPVSPGGEPTTMINGLEFRQIGDGELTLTDQSVLSGSGKIIFRKTLPEDNNFVLKFNLEVGGTLTLLANADNNLQVVIMLSFTRNSDDTLKVMLKAGADKLWDLSEDFEDISAKGQLNLSIDVHPHGHINVWVDGEESYRVGAFKKQNKNPLFGIELNKATLNYIEVRDPVIQH